MYYRYRNEGLKQVYKLLGASDILGNPVGLITNVGRGFQDLFHEVAYGFKDKDGSVLRGLVVGAQSIIKAIFGGLFGSLARMAGALYSIFKLDPIFTTFDGYRESKAGNIFEGVGFAIRNTGVELCEGVAGVVVLPYRGGKKDGLCGVIKGFFRGSFGLTFTLVLVPLTVC